MQQASSKTVDIAKRLLGVEGEVVRVADRHFNHDMLEKAKQEGMEQVDVASGKWILRLFKYAQRRFVQVQAPDKEISYFLPATNESKKLSLKQYFIEMEFNLMRQLAAADMLEEDITSHLILEDWTTSAEDLMRRAGIQGKIRGRTVTLKSKQDERLLASLCRQHRLMMPDVNIVESIDPEIAAIEDWQKKVKTAYPKYASKMKFKARHEGGKNMLSAEVSGLDRCFGVFDLDRLTGEVLKEKLEWHDSSAPEAHGRFRDLGVADLAQWLIKTRKGDIRRITGSLNQQIAFNKDDPAYVKKMQSTRRAVMSTLKKD